MSGRNDANRVLNRLSARALTPEEIESVNARQRTVPADVHAPAKCGSAGRHFVSMKRRCRQASECTKNEKEKKVCRDKKTTEYSRAPAPVN
jgi:hypothetical protein